MSNKNVPTLFSGVEVVDTSQGLMPYQSSNPATRQEAKAIQNYALGERMIGQTMPLTVLGMRATSMINGEAVTMYERDVDRIFNTVRGVSDKEQQAHVAVFGARMLQKDAQDLEGLATVGVRRIAEAVAKGSEMPAPPRSRGFWGRLFGGEDE